MKWQSPKIGKKLDKILGTICAIVLAPIWVPAFAIVFTLGGIIWVKRWFVGPSKYWSRWFAWYPVYVPSYYISKHPSAHGAWVWLEFIERECWGVTSPIYYRQINGEYHD